MGIIHIHYVDIGERGPRGCGYFSAHRLVKNVADVSGGRTGAIQYKGRSVPVYQREGSATLWTTDREVLEPLKITYLR